jgi:hypothetical protein
MLFSTNYKFLTLSLFLVLFLYYPSLNKWAAGDDFSTILVEVIDPNERWDIFPKSGFAFRPIEKLVNSINAKIIGFESSNFTHSVALIGFILSVLLVFVITNTYYKENINASYFSTILFILNPNNVTSVTQIDTISQQYATVFTLLATWWLSTKKNINEVFYYIIYGLILFLVLFSKENPICLIFCLPLSIFIIRYSSEDLKYYERKKELILLYFITFTSFILYVSLRLYFGMSFSGTNQYQVSISFIKIIKNCFLLIGSVVYTGSSLDIFPHIEYPKVFVSIMILICLSLINVQPLKNLYTKHKISPRNILDNKIFSIFIGIWIIILSGLFPVVLIGKMSELYTYTFTPFYFIFIGIILAESIKYYREKNQNNKYISTYVIVLFLSLWFGYGTYDKIQHLIITNDKTKQYYSTISEICEISLEDNIDIMLSSSISTNIENNYNIIHFSDISILKSFTPLLQKVYNKKINYIIKDENYFKHDFKLYKIFDSLQFLKN